MRREYTILVLCYNAQTTILETLKSIEQQNFSYLHIIISDDCSTDETYEIVQKWEKDNTSKFLSCRTYRNENNVGTSKHLNMRMMDVETEWVKIIGGDDILLPDCIANFHRFIKNNKNNGALICSNMVTFTDTKDCRNYKIDYEEILYQRKFGTREVREQLNYITKREILCSPTMLINIEVFKKIGGCDEKIRNIEDWPLKIRFLQNGYKIDMMNCYTVLYRAGDSVSRSSEIYFKPEFLSQVAQIKKMYCYNYAKKDIKYRWNEAVTQYRYNIIINKCKNRRNKCTYIVNILLGLLNTEKIHKAIINVAGFHREKIIVRNLIRKYDLR